MKFLHIADLHLGKRMNDVSLIEDQKYILDQIADIAEKKKVDALLIAGDIYQSISPSAEAMSLFSDFVNCITGKNIKIYAISGNHDSDSRIAYFSKLLRSSGVYLSERFCGALQQFEESDEYGDIVINLLPYVKPVHVRKYFPDENINSYNDAVSCIIKNSKTDTSKRNIILCHQFITGGVCSDSDFSVGGLENIDAETFEDFDYVALGHLHRAQKIQRETLRYAGSPLKYSFAEADHKKSVCIVDINEKNNIEVEIVPVSPMRDVREIKGHFADIMNMPASMDYVRVVLTDELIAPDAMITLTTVFPNMLSFAINNSKTKTETDVAVLNDVEDKSIQELFCDFFRMQNNDRMPSEAHLEAFERALVKAQEGRYETD